MKETGVAARYAQALFLALKESERGSVEAVRKGLSEVHKIVASNPKLKADLRNPLIPLEQKKSALGKKLGEAGDAVLSNFINLLLTKKRLELLPLILSHFEQAVEASQGILKAYAKSAKALSGAAKKEIEKTLSGLFGKKVVLETSVDPELLAGLIIKAGDTVFDHSLKTQLKNLKVTLRS